MLKKEFRELEKSITIGSQFYHLPTKMLVACAAATMGILIGPPMMAPMVEVRQFQPAALTRSSVLLADLLDDLAVDQQAYEAKLNAQKEALRSRVAAAEAEQRAEAEKAERYQAERESRIEVAKAEKATKAEAARVAAEQMKAAHGAKEAAAASTAGAASKSKKSYGEVQRVKKQSGRIAERKARGELAPSLF